MPQSNGFDLFTRPTTDLLETQMTEKTEMNLGNSDIKIKTRETVGQMVGVCQQVIREKDWAGF